jgi:hypothetical protein
MNQADVEHTLTFEPVVAGNPHALLRPGEPEGRIPNAGVPDHLDRSGQQQRIRASQKRHQECTPVGWLLAAGGGTRSLGWRHRYDPPCGGTTERHRRPDDRGNPPAGSIRADGWRSGPIDRHARRRSLAGVLVGDFGTPGLSRSVAGPALTVGYIALLGRFGSRCSLAGETEACDPVMISTSVSGWSWPPRSDRAAD